jgi:hypothetical protein
MHGAHRLRSALSGEKHPNYRHGQATDAARLEHRLASARLRHLETLGNAISMFLGPRFAGRKPKP